LDFKDATIITVAHRLNTIIDYGLIIETDFVDRIAVFDQGSVVEFGSPKELLDIVDGAFKSLVAETGLENEALLRSLAR
jgi:ATP-binding cassette subfamily C (CFTR/MRP) protein 4